MIFLGICFTTFGFNFVLGGRGWWTRGNKCRLQTKPAVAKQKKDKETLAIGVYSNLAGSLSGSFRHVPSQT